MLYETGVRHSARDMFRETMLRILSDPLNHREEWPWASFYWDLAPESERREAFDQAVQTIHEAGFDPVHFR